MVMNRTTLRYHVFHGKRIPVDPPTPPTDLVEILGYEAAIKYGVYMTLPSRFIPISTPAKYLGIDTNSKITVQRRFSDIHRDTARKLNKLAPVQPPHWLAWIERMKEELIAFDFLVRRPTLGRLPIVAFAGPDRVGKSMMAGWFHKKMGGQRLHFASRLKELAEELKLADNVGDGDKSTWERAVYLTIGQVVRKLINPGYWIVPVAESIDPGQWNIIDDLRFKNEAEWVRKMGGIIIRVKRPGHDYHPSQQRDAFKLQDYSEIERSSAPNRFILGIVENGGTLRTTRQQFDEMFRYLFRAGEVTLAEYRRKLAANY